MAINTTENRPALPEPTASVPESPGPIHMNYHLPLCQTDPKLPSREKGYQLADKVSIPTQGSGYLLRRRNTAIVEPSDSIASAKPKVRYIGR